MKRKQLQLLFACNLVIFLSGSGIMAVLPIYATDLGGSSSMIGLYMAFLSLAFAAGNMITSWLARLLSSKVLYVLAGSVGSLTLALHIYVATFWQAFVLTGVVWMAGGIGLALSHIFTARLADQEQRGATFSLMALSFPLASLFGGLLVGPLIAVQGYAVMFLVLSMLWSLWPISSLLWLDAPALMADNKTNENLKHLDAADSTISETPTPRSGAAQRVAPNEKSERSPIFLLIAASFMASMAISSIRLTVPLSMQSLQFSASAIVSIATVSGLVTIPLALLYGNLSDKLGKKEILGWRYLLLIAGAILALTATNLWQFWAASVLVFATMAIGGSVARAFATDLLPIRHLESGLGRLESIGSLAGMIGSIGAGYLIDLLGPSPVYSLAALFSVIALLILDRIPSQVGDKMTVFLRIEQLIISKLMQDFAKRQTRRALDSAYVQFSYRNPRWADSLFDKRFLEQRAKPLLQNHIQGISTIDAATLAHAWTEQINYKDEAQRQGHIAHMAPIATEFLKLFEIEGSQQRWAGGLNGQAG